MDVRYKMPNKGKLTDQQVVINKFAFCLLKHFKNEKIKVQDTTIKINLDQLCSQDLDFLNDLKRSVNGDLGLNVSRSGAGLRLLIGVAKITELPQFLINYKRAESEL